MSNSATGGYLLPTTTLAPPRGLTLTQFIGTVLMGISGLDGKLIRPKWQLNPPKQPDIGVNWLAFGIRAIIPSANAYVGANSDGSTSMQRQEALDIGVSIYGPDDIYIADLIRDGFQIQQNLEALRAANMGFTETTTSLRVPDLINERWVDRIEFGIILQREVQRTYAVLPIVSATGTIHSVVGNEEYLLDWDTTN